MLCLLGFNNMGRFKVDNNNTIITENKPLVLQRKTAFLGFKVFNNMAPLGAAPTPTNPPPRQTGLDPVGLVVLLLTLNRPLNGESLTKQQLI